MNYIEKLKKESSMADDYIYKEIKIGNNLITSINIETITSSEDINNFIEQLAGEVIDIKYQVSTSIFSEEQVYCFSAMIIYYEK